MKRKLFYIAEPPTVSTGFGTVSKFILPALAKEFTIHMLCSGGFGREVEVGLLDYGVSECTYTDQTNLHGMPQLQSSLKKFDPHVVFTYYDVGSVMEYLKSSFISTYPHASYLITEGEPMMLSWCRMFKDEDFRAGKTRNKFEVDEIVLPSDYSRQVAVKQTGVDCKVGWHGADHVQWIRYPDNVRKSLRQQLAESVHQNWDLDNVIILGYNARNVDRKQWPRLFEAIKIAQAQLPNNPIYLYAHTKVWDNYKLGGWALHEEVIQAGMDPNHVIFSQISDLQGMPWINDVDSKDASLCKFYNTLDMYVHPSAVEGAGLPLLEAAKCGVPVLTTQWGGGWDYAKDYAVGLPVSDFYKHSSGVKQALVSIPEMANQIVKVARNRSLQHQLSAASLKNCNYKWSDLGDRCVEAAINAIGKFKKAY